MTWQRSREKGAGSRAGNRGEVMTCHDCRRPSALTCPMCHGELQLAADGEMIVCVDCGYVRRIVKMGKETKC